MRKKNKSDEYQYRIVEIGMNPNELEWAAAQLTINDHLIRQEPNEEIVIAQKELLELIKNKIDNNLTDHQKMVLTKTLNGESQQSIADELGIEQCAISKCLYGNFDYIRNKCYGGCVRKLQKQLLNDDRAKYLMAKIARFRNV